MNRIITIGREFGSGGRELGRRLAEELGIEYFDSEIITEISKHTSLSEQYVKQIVECQPHHLYPITVGRSLVYTDSYSFSQAQSVYKAQSDIIKEMAGKADCVIIGRCADYILQDMKPYRIFVYADMDSKVKRCMSRMTQNEHYNERQMRKYIRSVDRNRAKYYGFYSGLKWGDKLNYDLCINTTDTEIKSIVPIIAKMF